MGQAEGDGQHLEADQQKQQHVQDLVHQGPEGHQFSAAVFRKRRKAAAGAKGEAGDNHGNRPGHAQGSRQAEGARCQGQRKDKFEMCVIDRAHELYCDPAKSQPENRLQRLPR